MTEQRVRDINPEGFTRYGGDCVCGPVYTYAGIAEPGQFDPFCPVHGDPEYVETLTPSSLDEFHPDTSMWRSGDDGQ